MLKIAIVDDDAKYIRDLQDHITKYQEENAIEAQISTFSDGLKLLAQYQPVYDILFLDIEMPHMNGIELAKIIRKTDPYVIIIFITNMAQFAVKGYEVNAFDYLMKPVQYFQFSLKLKEAVQSLEKAKGYSLLVPYEDQTRPIKSSDILYIEVSDHWLLIQTIDAQYRMLGTMKDMEEKLKNYYFIRCNKCYLINLEHVIHLKVDEVILQGDHKLKISRGRRKDVQFAFIDYYSEKRMG